MILRRKLIIETPVYEYDVTLEHQNRETEPRYYIRGPYMQYETKNKNNRKYLKEEMIKDADRFDREMIKTGRAGGELNHCVKNSYKILTADGWKQLKDISDNEQVYTLNTDTEDIELETISEKIDAPYCGKMIRIKGRNINALFTPNHRILIVRRTGKKEYITAEELFLRKNDSDISHSYIPKTGNWLVKSPKTFTLKGIPNVSKLGNYNNDITKDIEIDYSVFLSFLGLYLAEGHFNKGGRHYGVYITQIKDTFISEISEMLNKFPKELEWKKVKSGFVCHDRRLNNYVSSLGNCYNKFIPKDIKENSSAEDLEKLIYWFNIGDGRFNLVSERYKTRNVFTVCNQLISDLNECLFKCGASGNISIIEQNGSVFSDGRIILKETAKPLFLLNLSTTKGIYLDSRFIDISEEDFDGEIGCVVTPKNHNWYCMDDDGKTFWTGNSTSPEIDLSRLCHKILTLEHDESSKHFIGKSMILSTPSGKIMESLIRDGVKTGMSTKALGQIEESSDCNVVKQFFLIGVDCVYDPSYSSAFVNGILESKEFILGADNKFEEAYDKFEAGLSKYPSKYRDQINAHIRLQVENFLNSLKQ